MTSSSSSSYSSSTSSSSTSSSTSSSSGAGVDHSTIRTAGGTVTVQRRDGVLDVVDVTTEDGWHADRTEDDEQTVVVAFTGPSARVDVTIRLSPTGISSSTSSVITG